MSKSRLIDVPVQSCENEALGVGMYAEILASFITSCETPITIGIQGDWGIGKTSMLNMVREQLAPAKGRQAKYHVIYFNTWQYSQFSQEQVLGLSILKGIMAEVQNLDSLKAIQKTDAFKSAVKGFGTFIGNLGNQLVKEHTGLDAKEALPGGKDDSFLDNDIVVQLRQMKDEFSKLVQVLVPGERDRLVIMIDDLDRIKPVRALEFLEAIKNFLDVESCVFVMAVDYSVIQSGMVEKLGRSAQELQGKSYFDKIIQVPFTMPSSSYQTDKYVMSLLGWNCSAQGKYEKVAGGSGDFFLSVVGQSVGKKEIEFFTNITGLTVGNNPRSIKRAVNYANLLKMVVQARWSGSGRKWTMESAQLLYPLACMQLAWPELFVHFANEPNPGTLSLMQDFEYLQRLKGLSELFRRVYNPDETMSNITGFIDEFIGLVDEDENGQISSKEFAPIWQMMVDANLTSSKYKNLEEDWQKLRDMILKQMGDRKDSSLIDKIFFLFRDEKSHWNDPRNFDLLSAGKKFSNITWNRKQVGSFVSTQGQPAQLYLKGAWADYCENVVDEAKPYLFDVHNVGHYGTGDVRVDIVEIAKRGDGVPLMNSIFEAMKIQLIG